MSRILIPFLLSFCYVNRELWSNGQQFFGPISGDLECTCTTILDDRCKCSKRLPALGHEERRCSPQPAIFKPGPNVTDKLRCEERLGPQCLSNKFRANFTQAYSDCLPVGRPGDGVVETNLITHTDLMKVELNWPEPPGAQGSVVTGYLLQMFLPVSSDKQIGSQELPCACTLIPPCQRSFSFSRVYSQNLVEQSQFAQCLDLMSAAERSLYRFRLLALPISYDGNLTKTSAWGEVEVKSCQEYDDSHLGPLCRAKLKLLPPKWSTANVHYKLENHTIRIEWSRPESLIPIQFYEISVRYLVVTGGSKKGLVMDSVKLPPNTTRHVFQRGFLPERQYEVQLLAHGYINWSEPSLSATLGHMLRYAYGSDDYAALEMFKSDLNYGISKCWFKAHFGQDGEWNEWGKWTTCYCGPNINRTRQRTCSPPGRGGLWCNGTSVDTEECPVVACPQISHYQRNKKIVDSAESHSARGKAAQWFKQPMFYVTLSTGFLVLLLVALIVIKLTQRRRQRRSGARQPLLTSVQGESSVSSLSVPRCIQINGPSSSVIYLENDFRPPDIDLIAAFDDNTNCNNSSTAHEVEPILSSAAKQTTVFISYARFSDIHDKNVLDFASWLARLGLNVFLDKWDTIGLGADIAGWTERKLLSADKVVVVLSSEYYFDWYSMEGQSGDEERCPDRQACLEAKLIQALIMEGRCTNRVCVPVFLGPAYDRACIPAILENSVWFRLLEDDVAAARHFLYYLCGVEEHQRPDIGGLTERAVSSDSILI